MEVQVSPWWRRWGPAASKIARGFQAYAVRLRKWWRGGDRLLALGTIILAAANLGMLVEMRFSNQQQHEDTIAALAKTDATIAAQNAQAKIMQGQLQEMEVAQRPWVTADITPSQDAIFNDQGASFGLQFFFRNTGRSPAWAFISINAFPLPENAARAELNTCASRVLTSMGMNVFPGERVPINIGFDIGMPSLNDMWNRNPTMKPAFYPFVVACIIYSSLSNSTPHHTPFMYQIKRTNNMGFLFKKGDSIPMSDLKLFAFPLFGRAD